MQFAACSLDAYEPSLQSVHSTAPVEAARPEGHTEQFTEEALLHLPASQERHVVAPVVTGKRNKEGGKGERA